MSKRQGVVATAWRPADGTGATMGTTSGYSPTAYAPMITAHVRVYWPPLASKEQVLDALNAAVEEAMDKFEVKFEEEQ